MNKISFETYEQFEGYLSILKKKRCKNCSITFLDKTWHKSCGYKGYNHRWECLKCGEERA